MNVYNGWFPPFRRFLCQFGHRCILNFLGHQQVQPVQVGHQCMLDPVLVGHQLDYLGQQQVQPVQVVRSNWLHPLPVSLSI